MGLVDEKVRDFYGLTAAPVAAMVRFNVLAEMGQAARVYSEVARMPAIKRDLSIVVAESVTWEEIESAVQASAGELLEELTYVGTYRGKQVGSGRKSVTLRLTYRHGERTLRHEEVDSSVVAVVEQLKSQFQCGAKSLKKTAGMQGCKE